MIKIGLTGNIASGKSQAEAFFKKKDIPIIDADEVCRELLAFDDNIIETIKNSFKEFDVTSNDKLDRKKLANLIYNNNFAKKKLEEILHPPIIKEISNFFEQNKNRDIVIASVPLLFEAELEYLFDKIVLISADENIRIKRLMNRNNINEEFAQKMIVAQLPEAVKLPKADYVVYNNHDLSDFNNNLFDLYTKLQS